MQSSFQHYLMNKKEKNKFILILVRFAKSQSLLQLAIVFTSFQSSFSHIANLLKLKTEIFIAHKLDTSVFIGLRDLHVQQANAQKSAILLMLALPLLPIQPPAKHTKTHSYFLFLLTRQANIQFFATLILTDQGLCWMCGSFSSASTSSPLGLQSK